MSVVMIEGDGKTEEEFLNEVLNVKDQIEALSKEVRQLDRIIGANVRLITGEE